MADSQNGYSVDPTLNKNPFPGTKIVAVPGVRKGNVATVLHYVGSQFDKNVEKLVNPGCWGYVNRPIRGSTVTSNHASATAIDLNAPKHPLGASGTFSAKQKSEIRKILNYCDGVVRWGGDYSDRKDEMHFEIIKGSTAVSNLAKKIKNDKVEDMLTRSQQNILYRVYLGKPVPEKARERVGKVTYAEEQKRLIASDVYKSRISQAKAGDLKAENHLPVALRKAYKP